MTMISRGESLLCWIEDDIETKYNIKKPVFTACQGKVTNRKEVTEWMSKWLRFEVEKWIKYRCVKDNIFELKEYFPSPPDEACKKRIAEQIDFYEKLHDEEIFWSWNDVIYTKKEIEKEMLFEVRNNYPVISAPGPIKDPNSRLNRVIYDVRFCDDELGRIIPEGYLILEQK